MSSASSREARHSASDFAAALAPFAEIATRVLPSARRDAMVAAASLIAPWTVHPKGERAGGALCADGTAVETSLAFDASGAVELRLVGDVGAGISASSPAERRRQVIERCALFAGSGDVGALVGELAARHIDRLPPAAKALAFVGAGASAASPFHRMFYFSFAGMASAAAQALVACHVDASIVARLWALTGKFACRMQGVGYDVEGGRIAKLQLYARFPVAPGQDIRQLVSQIDDENVARSAEMLSAILPPVSATSNHHMLGLGMATERSGAQRVALRLYAPLVAHGIDSFNGLGPTLAAIAARWGAAAPGVLGLASAYTPTLLSVSGAANAERCAIYFGVDSLSGASQA